MKDLVIAFVLGVALSVLVAAVAAVAVMAVLAMWHAHNPAVPALGFIDCVFAVWLTSVLTLTGVVVTRR